jgi:hypothetical protein
MAGHPIKAKLSPYLSRRWLPVYGYLVILIVVTPYLPLLINLARKRWQAGYVSSFVLVVEIAIAVLLLFLAVAIYFVNRRKFLPFTLILGGLIAFCYIFYLFNPNPYELTHLPEYAIMGILFGNVTRAGKKGGNKNYFFIRSGLIILVLGTADEVYQGLLPLRFFRVYDIMLNALGGILGLIVFWGLKKD